MSPERAASVGILAAAMTDDCEVLFDALRAIAVALAANLETGVIDVAYVEKIAASLPAKVEAMRAELQRQKQAMS